MIKLLTLGILFSTAVRAELLVKLVILGISPLTSFILTLRGALVANLVTWGILSSILFILALYTSFYIYTSVFTTLHTLLKSGISTNFHI